MLCPAPVDTDSPEEHPPGLVKISVAFEPQDYAWVVERSKALYGRRGQGMYLRKLVKLDRESVSIPEMAHQGQKLSFEK